MFDELNEIQIQKSVVVSKIKIWIEKSRQIGHGEFLRATSSKTGLHKAQRGSLEKEEDTFEAVNQETASAHTGKSFSEALILESVNPQYDKRLFIEFPEKYKLTTCCVQILDLLK